VGYHKPDMGKQVGFFMTLDDELMFISATQNEFGPFVIVANSSRSEREIIGELKPVDAFTANLSLVRADDLHDIVSTHVAAQNLFCVDLLNSKAVQFNRCKAMNGWLAPGRLWFEEKLDGGKKSSDFRLWANKLLSWFSKNWPSTDDGLYFIGPEAKKMNETDSLKLGPPQEGMSPEEVKKALGLS
jgi:hypothetical protein